MDRDKQTDIPGNGHRQLDRHTRQWTQTARQIYQAMEIDRQIYIPGHGHRQLDRPTRQWTQTDRQTYQAMDIDRYTDIPGNIYIQIDRHTIHTRHNRQQKNILDRQRNKQKTLRKGKENNWA